MARGARWTLRELLNFEWLLRNEEPRSEGAERSLYRREVREKISDEKDASAKRRKGLLHWFRARSEAGGETFTSQMPAERLLSGLNLARWGLVALFFISGASLVWGMVERPAGLLNLGTFLAAALGVQILILLIGALILLFRRRVSATLSFLGSMAMGVVFFLTRGAGRESWQALVQGGQRYQKVASWKLASIGQAGAVAFNVGLLAGLLSLFLVLDVGLYWQTTVDGEPEQTVEKIIDTIALPWSAVAPRYVPDLEAVKAIRLRPGSGATIERGAEFGAVWPVFVLLAVVFWGLLPRLLLSALSWFSLRQSLATLEFQSPRHRELWRKMSHVERVVETEGQMDKAVIIDCGGAGLKLDDIAGFIRARLRLFPQSIHQTGVIGDEREAASTEALKAAEAGVVMMVESWDLSPKLVQRRHRELRALIGDRLPVWYVVHNDGTGNVEADQIAQWKGVVDAIEDASADVVAYEEMHFGKGGTP